MTALPEYQPVERRRTNFLHFAGSAALDPYDSTTGRFFPETATDLSWYRKDPNPIMRESAKVWAHAVEKLCGVHSLNEITGLFGEEARARGISKKEEDVTKKQIYDRFREAFAQRHRIKITDTHRRRRKVDFGITLSYTRDGEELSMYKRGVDKLIKDSLVYAKEVIDYLHDPQTGLLRGLSNVLPGRVNEPRNMTNPVDLLLMCFSSKWNSQSRFEARQFLGLADVAAEVLLHRKKYEGIQDEMFTIFNHHGVFNTEKHGPREKPLEFITLHNPQTFAVEGVQILGNGDSYDPNPYILYNRLIVREATDVDGAYYVQLNDEPKGIVQTILKMMRRNTMDPAEIRDNYRMAATFVNRGDIERFREAIITASQRAGKPIKIIEEENTLDGGDYEARTNGEAQRYAGSSRKYQVLRLRLYFEDRENLPIELSCYTLEAHVNYIVRNEVNIGEYLISRQILHEPEKVDAPVFEYIDPFDIYGVDISEHKRELVKGIRTSVREKAFVLNTRLTRKPREMAEEEIGDAVKSIIKQIQPPLEDNHSTAQLDYKTWPEVVISIGSNCYSAGNIIAKSFNIPYNLHLQFSGPRETIALFLMENATRLRGKRILLLDDIGIEATTVSEFDKLLHSIAIDTKIAFLALKPGSKASEIAHYFGTEIQPGQYLFFPPQLHEHMTFHMGAFGIITRNNNGTLEVLLQEENDGRIKLPGGTFDEEKGDGSMFETLRRELEEEDGPELKLEILKGLVHELPISECVFLDLDAPASAVNALYLRGYRINGQAIRIENFIPPEGSEVRALHWMPFDQALKTIQPEGYRLLLESFARELKNGK